MISFLRGIIASKNENGLVIDVNGVGFAVNMPTSDIAKAGAKGEEIVVHTYFHVSEMAMQLYGFLTTEEMDYFNKLISISGWRCISKAPAFPTETKYGLFPISNFW